MTWGLMGMICPVLVAVRYRMKAAIRTSSAPRFLLVLRLTCRDDEAVVFYSD
jgi:hypothetical protein